MLTDDDVPLPSTSADGPLPSARRGVRLADAGGMVPLSPLRGAFPG